MNYTTYLKPNKNKQTVKTTAPLCAVADGAKHALALYNVSQPAIYTQPSNYQ